MKIIVKIPLVFQLLIIGIVCTQTACEKPDPDAIIYYKAIGKGYVFDATNNRPLANVTINIKEHYGQDKSGGYWSSRIKTVVTDKNGYYQIRFMEKYRPSANSIYFEVTQYAISVGEVEAKLSEWKIVYPMGNKYSISVFPSSYLNEIDSLALDTIKFYKPNI